MKVKIIHHPTDERCIASAKKLQGLLPFESELYSKYSDLEPEKFPEHEVVNYREMDQKYDPPDPVVLKRMLGCIFTHYSIWETMTENTLILEDDTRPLHDRIDLDLLENFDGDVINLGTPIFMGEHTNRKAFLEMITGKQGLSKKRKVKGSCLYGAHAYLVTPKGAEKLNRATRYSRLARPNDMTVNIDTVDIQDLKPFAFEQAFYERWSYIRGDIGAQYCAQKFGVFNKQP